MATCEDFKKMATARLKAGDILLAAGDADLAVDCFGLALELTLKAAICRTLNLQDYPDKGKSEISQFFRTHAFDVLLTLSGFDKDITGDKRKKIFKNWSKATSEWSVNAKYDPIGSKLPADARRMYRALTEDKDGIINWINKKIHD